MKTARGIVRWIRNLFVKPKKQVTNNNRSRRPKKRSGFMNTMRISGTVKFFNQDKGFGFIKMGEKDIFVHATELRHGTTIDENDKVEFAVGQGKKGDVAVDVALIEKGQPSERKERRPRRDRGHDARF